MNEETSWPRFVPHRPRELPDLSARWPEEARLILKAPLNSLTLGQLEGVLEESYPIAVSFLAEAVDFIDRDGPDSAQLAQVLVHWTAAYRDSLLADGFLCDLLTRLSAFFNRLICSCNFAHIYQECEPFAELPCYALSRSIERDSFLEVACDVGSELTLGGQNWFHSIVVPWSNGSLDIAASVHWLDLSWKVCTGLCIPFDFYADEFIWRQANVRQLIKMHFDRAKPRLSVESDCPASYCREIRSFVNVE